MDSNELLYHYTTTDSFLSIVNGGELWASHIRYLNDTSEQRLAWDHVRARISNRLKTASDEVRERLLPFQSLANSPLDLDLYVLCFSKDGGDRLSQWRGYGESGGVAIGFEAGELIKRCSHFVTECSRNRPYPMGWAFLNQVRYVEPTEDDQSNLVIDLFIDNPNPTETESRFSKEEVFSLRISLSSANLKHKAFQEENEWRVAIFDVPAESVQYRCRRSMIVPFVGFDLGKGSPEWPLIQRVVVGPSPHQSETAAAIMKRLDGRIVVEKSSVPFRGW